MTDQITAPRATWDAMLGALDECVGALGTYTMPGAFGGRVPIDTDVVNNAIQALTAANAVSHPQATDPAQRCWCETCRPVTLGDMRMVVCPECSNKRCPMATHHNNPCTNSNDIGQKGSSWEHVKPAAPEAKQITPPTCPPCNQRCNQGRDCPRRK